MVGHEQPCKVVLCLMQIASPQVMKLSLKYLLMAGIVNLDFKGAVYLLLFESLEGNAFCEMLGI